MKPEKKDDKKLIAAAVTPEFKEWIAGLAEEEGRTFAGQVVRLLTEAKNTREQKQGT